MRHSIAALPAVLALLCVPALAEEHQKQTDAAAAVKLTMSECDSLWKKADANNAGKVSETSAASYISDIKAVNKDGDTTIEKTEFSKACQDGLIKKAALQANTTTGSTTKPSPPSETSDRTPDKKSPTPPEQIDSSGGKTSDRTPNN